MQTVSVPYKTAINDIERTFKAFLEITFNEGIVASYTVSSGSNAADICNGVFRPTDYASVGSISIPSSQGWRSNAVADASGNIAAQILTVSYAPAVSSKHIWLVGRLSNYPVNFVVEIMENNVWTTLVTVTGNTKWCWYTQLASKRTIQSVRFTITKISTVSDTALVVECGLINKLVFTDEDVERASLLTEASAESRNPVGSITANELDVDVANEEGWFNSTGDGPIKGLIVPGLKLKMHTGTLLPDTTYESVTWGTFYLTDCFANTSDVNASISAQDRLYKIMSRPAQNKMPSKNVAVKTLFEQLFLSIGLTPADYDIDTSLSRVIPVGWMPAGTVGEVLQNYCVAGLCAVYVMPSDKIKVADITLTKTSVETFTEDNQVIDFQNPQDFASVYSCVDVAYKTPRLSDSTELASIEGISVPTAGITISNIPFSGIVGVVTYAILVGATNSKITSVTYGTKSITVQIANTGATETVKLVIAGKTIESDGALVRVADPTLYEMWPDRVLSVDNEFIQNQAAASTYANTLIGLANDPQAFYKLQVRGNPAIELMDTVTIAGGNSIKTTEDLPGIVIRQTLSYDGGLEGTMVLRKPL